MRRPRFGARQSWMRRAALLLSLSLLLGCDKILGIESGSLAAGSAGAAGSGGVASGVGGAGGATGGGGAGIVLGPNDLALDSFTIGLGGLISPNEDARRSTFLQTVAHLDSDVICLQGVYRQSDKMMIQDAAASGGSLVHSLSFVTSDVTPIDDSHDLDGDLRTPIAPACAGDMKPKLDAVLDCLVMSCSTVPGSDTGSTSDAACAENNCLGQLGALALDTTQPGRTCFGCLAPLLTAETLGTIRSSCETSTSPALGFEGQNSVLLLSKRELTDPKMYVLPSSWFRRVVVKATISAGAGASPLDVYCTELPIIPHNDGLFPYTGVFGAGDSADGWQNENYLEATRLVSFVNTTSNTRPAILLGAWGASPGINDANGKVVSKPDALDSLQLLSTTFPEAVAADFVPTCTVCADNENLVAAGQVNFAPSWQEHIFLKGIPPENTRQTRVLFTEKIVAGVDSKGQPAAVPLSPQYGLRSVVTIP